jgi:hypothetical protein
MKILSWLVAGVLLVGMMPVGAGAVLDPTPDLLGVYFDTQADFRDMFIGASIPFNMHFILSTPTASHILGYEFSYEMSVQPGQGSLVFKLGHTFPPGINDLTMPIYEGLAGEVRQSWPAPVPTTDAVVLMTFQYMLLVPLTAYLTPGPAYVETIVDGLPAYWDGVNTYPMGVSFCSGVINDYCGIAVERESFGAVKALYR